jgi:hypothetical protein
MKASRSIPALALAAAALAAAGCGAAASTVSKPAFATTHVTLYDCGLAQIEKQSEVDGASALEIRVERAHLDDLLASLVIATDGTVKVKGVKFPSVKNLGQAIAASGMAGTLFDGSGGLEMPSDLAGYAQALSGTSVVITTKDGKETRGTVLDAIVPPEGADPAAVQAGPEQEPLVVLVTQDGTLRWITLAEVAEITPVSPLEAASLKSFASALGKANGFNEETVVLETTVESKGRLAASYVRQAPVWRMLYKTRIGKDKANFEAWAVVHNDTPESWTDVSMTLVSGLPGSYVFSIASPRYVHRELIEAPGGWTEMMPQLGADTPDSLLYTWDIYHGGEGVLGTMGFGAGGGGSGYGYGSGSGTLIGRAAGGSGEGPSSLIQVGESAAAETALPKVENEISTYTAMAAVSLPAGATSLVPLISRDLPGQAFTLVDPKSTQLRTCARMENTTGLVLQPGMVSFYREGRFRGEAELDRLEPGGVSVLCYGEDMDLSFDYLTDAGDLYSALEWKQGTLWVHSLRTTVTDYAIDNAAGQDRDVAIEITHITNGRVVEPKGTLSTESPTRELYPLTVSGQSSAKVRIVVEEGVRIEVPLTTGGIDKILEPGTLPPAQADTLKAARAIIEEKEKTEKEVEDRQKTIAEHEAAVSWQKDLLAVIPQGGAAPKSVDSILADVKKEKKQIAVLQKEIEALTLKTKELGKQAVKPLEGLIGK